MTDGSPWGRIIFIGAVHEAEPALRAVLETPAQVVRVVTLAEPLASRTAGFVELGVLADAHGIPVLRTTDVNDPALVAALAADKPDLIVCVGWTRLLHDAVLRVPRHGCVGFHASLLPRHRGRAPVNWAILRGEQTTGNTMIMLSPGVDEGDIVDQELVEIDFEDTCATVYAKVAYVGARMLRRHLKALLEGTARRYPQPVDNGEVLLKRTPEMGIIGWNAAPLSVYNWIRALTHPYPGAFTQLAGRRVHLWQSDRPVEGEFGPPATILGTDDDGVYVSVERGRVRLLAVQDDGAPSETGAQWCQRRRLSPGVRFDPVDDETIAWARGQRSAPSASQTLGAT
jgi:methionyl-tRNA formyltransferase